MNLNNINLNKLFQSKKFTASLIIIGEIIILLLAFKAGELTAFRKANFMSHGIIGSITKIDGNDITIMERNGAEKDIVVSDNTKIKIRRHEIALANLRSGDRVVIIGSPNADGQTEAKLIRVFKDFK